MPKDVSLDSFGPPADDAESSEAERDEEAVAETAASEDAASSAPNDESAVGPAASTYAWSPEGTCATCGDAAERRWRDDGDLVCADCKSW